MSSLVRDWATASIHWGKPPEWRSRPLSDYHQTTHRNPLCNGGLSLHFHGHGPQEVIGPPLDSACRTGFGNQRLGELRHNGLHFESSELVDGLVGSFMYPFSAIKHGNVRPILSPYFFWDDFPIQTWKKIRLRSQSLSSRVGVESEGYQ